MKKRYFSAHFDFKTGLAYKFLLILGLILIIFSITQNFLHFIPDENILGISIAFSIIFVGAGLLIYFLHVQFTKLSKIADEIENEEIDISK